MGHVSNYVTLKGYKCHWSSMPRLLLPVGQKLTTFCLHSSHPYPLFETFHLPPSDRVPSLSPPPPSSYLQPSSTHSVIVRLGEYRLYTAADGPHVDLRPVSAVIHPAYSHIPQRYDLGILTLPYDVTNHTRENSGLTEDIRPICLPPAGADFTGEDGIVLGEDGTGREDGIVLGEDGTGRGGRHRAR